MRNTRPRPPAQARLNTATESSIAVYDGATRIGSIIECGSEHHAWHHHRQAHLGAFKTRTEAMR